VVRPGEIEQNVLPPVWRFSMFEKLGLQNGGIELDLPETPVNGRWK
jgi:hypothetical protein